jgi:hypothetical protein
MNQKMKKIRSKIMNKEAFDRYEKQDKIYS